MNPLLIEKIRLLEELYSEAVHLLMAARCPNCDGCGVVGHSDDDYEPCEWCFYRDKLKDENIELSTLTEKIKDEPEETERAERIHKLKTWSEFFELVISGKKTFEIRTNDRNFKVGDRLDLMEYDHIKGEYTGAHCHRYITHILGNNPFINLGDKVILSMSCNREESLQGNTPSGMVSDESKIIKE